MKVGPRLLQALRHSTSAGLAYDGRMPRFAPLLRALLCLILLANGAAYAHAATRMAIVGMPSEEMVTAHDAPPCHADMVMPQATMHHDAGIDGHAADLPDCCEAGNCDGFCTQHAPVLTWHAPMGPLPYGQAGAPDYLADAHASAGLSHRHRPPILTA